MTEAAPRRWAAEEFFACQVRQSERYALADGLSDANDRRVA